MCIRDSYTSDYFTGDPDHPVLRWSVRDPRRRDFWGHPVIPSWYTEASTVLNLDGRPRPLLSQEQTAEVTVGADGFTRLGADEPGELGGLRRRDLILAAD